MNNNYLTLTASFFSTLLVAQTNLQIEDATIDFNSSLTNLPLQVSFDAGKHLSETQFTEWMKNTMVKSGEASFELLKTERDQLGFKHMRYQQYHKGYKLDGSMIITHSKNQEVRSFNGDWFKDISMSNSPSLTEQQALQFALNKVNAQRYKWENEAEEAHMKEVLGNPGFSYKPVGELVILPVINETAKTVSYQYVYKFNIYAELPLYRAWVYVDASSGQIVREQNLICTIDATGTANTKYSGTQTITTDNFAGGYRLREAGRGNGIETYNLNNGTTYTNTDFTNTTNTWTATTTHQAATDAHWGAEMTYDYYMQTYNRNSIDGNGFKLLSYVHYSNNYANAFWDGQRMTYGDGNTSQGFTIMTALDVCGHEITHGLVQNTANLGNGEAGALNEAFADIFGTSVEWYARPTQHDWIMGKDIMTNGAGIRNMSNPNALQQPDTYQGTYWDAGGEVHTNDGPCIYWFYLLSVGGTGTNDNSQAYSVSAITMAKAADIAYRALSVYMTPGTNYANVRNYTIQAAKDLYGNCANEVIQTTNAWYAVGVGPQYSNTIAPDFSAAQGGFCSLPVSINFNNTTVNGINYTWDFGDGNTSASANPANTYTANGVYSVKLIATGCVAGSKDSLTKNSYITINTPVTPNASGDVVCEGTQAVLTANGNGTINWYDAPGGTLVGTGSNYTTPALNNTTNYYAVTTITNAAIYGGPATNAAFGGGGNFNANSDRYLIFDVHQNCVLKTVRVYASGAGNRTIELRDAAGAVLQSTVVNIPTGTQTVTLNFTLTPGNDYQLGTSGATVNMYRNNTNTGAGYPFNIGSLVSITNADAGSGYYYYFYNWEVKQNDCQSAAADVTATVNVCTGIQEATSINNIQVYPNPAKDNITVSLSKELAADLKAIIIYDALGKEVIRTNATTEQNTIRTGDLAPGIYTVQFITNSNERSVKRFVKD